jgi:hypothetical protein
MLGIINRQRTSAPQNTPRRFSGLSASSVTARHPITMAVQIFAPTSESRRAAVLRELGSMHQQFFRRDALPRSDAMETDSLLNACQKYE